MKTPSKLINQNPRTLLSVLASVATLLLFPETQARGQKPTSFPPADKLQAGDLIWPKKPGAVVPYNSRPGEADNSDAKRWKSEKKAYLEGLRKRNDLSAEEKERYSALQNMTYQEFLARYMNNLAPGEAAPFGAGAVAVGHVGIIQIINGTPTVVEAMVMPGVRRISYSDWVRERPGELIWVGRLRSMSPEKRAAVADIAARYIGRPYNFWKFNLKDDSGFYCSKLAWLSILTGAGFAPDDKANPKRILWYSPKQLMHSRHVKLIVNPGSYGSKRVHQ